MKKFQRFLWALLLGLGMALSPGALTGFAYPPQGRGNDHGNHGRDKKRERGREDRGRGHGNAQGNRGLHKGWYRDNRGYYRFNNDDRRMVDNYFRDHRGRWEHGPRGYALGYGHVIGQRYRRYFAPVPVVLVRQLPPPPPRCRYFLFGTNVVLVNSGYRVQDFIHIGINIGR